MKHVAWIACLSLGLPACGGGGNNDPDPDAAPDAPEEVVCGTIAGEPDAANPGFGRPACVVRAWDRVDGRFEEQVPDFSCLGTPLDDTPTSVDVTLTGTVRDFQNSENTIADANVEAFAGIDIANPFAQAVADGDGAFQLTVPAGSERVGFKVSAAGSLDTFLLNQIFDPDTAAQESALDSVTTGTADAVGLIVGVTRSAERGVLAAAVRDCNGNELSDTVATVSATAGQLDHAEGALSFYFSPQTGLPARNNLVGTTSENGLFVVLELPPAQQAALQVWGFLPGQDPGTDELTLIAELPAPVVANTVITASLDPLRQ